MGKVKNIKRVPRDLDTNFDFRFGDKLKKSGEIIVAHSTSSNLLPKILKEGLHRNTESVWHDSTKGKLYFELEPTRSYYGENVYGWKAVQKYGGANVTLYVKVKKDKLLVDSDDVDLGERYQKGQREYTYDVPPEDVLGLHFVGIDIAPKDFIEFYEMFSDYKMEMGGLFHGSPHEFEKFTTEKMSSGEGQQVFGFGLYFTDVEEVAKHYAERLADKDVKIGNSTATKLNEELSNPVFTWIIHYVHDRGWNKEQIIEELNRQLSDTDWVSKNKWVEPNILQVIPIIKENEISQIVEKRNLYKVTLSKGNENEIDWLLWDEPVTETQKQKISSNIDKLNDGKAKDRVISILKSPDWAGNNSGSKLYEYITDSFNKGMSGQKEASLFLLDAGIDGIKYKVGTLSGNEEKFEGFNYVVFDENLVTIEDMKKFNNGGNLMNSTKTEKMKNADNFYVNGGNIERELERSNKKPEEIISDEINFDTRKGLNRSDKVVPKEVIEEVEEQGMSLERLEELGLPIFKYQTQITVHGVFEGIGSGRVGGYKNLLANQNQTLGIKYNAIDLEKKRIISKTLRLDRDFNNIEGGFTSRMDSRGFEIYKRRIAENKEQYLKVVEELKEESKKIPSNFIGKKIVNAYNIWGRIVVELLIDFKAIKQDNLWSFISSITDGRVSNEQEFNTLLEKEKKQEDERNAVYKKEREEREAKEKALLNELKEKSTYSKLTSFPTSDEFIVAALGSSYGDTIIRVYSVFKNKTGRKVYSVNNYKNWSEVPTLISDDVKNSRGNKFFDESTIKLLTKYIEKGMLFDIYEKKKIEVKKVQPSSIYSETKTETIPAGDELLLDDSRYQLVKSKHTKTGDVIYLFKLKSRVDREDYKKIEANVKLIRGYYSSFVTAFVLKSAISANEAEMLLKGSVLEHKKENGGEISDNEKINEAAKEEVNKLVNETDITKEEAVKEMKEGVKVEEEHRETLEKLDKGEITVEEAVAETASVHIEEKKDYYTGGLNPMENKDKSNEELKKQLGEVELQLFNKAEERVPNVNLARTIELAENIAKLENKERKSDLAYFAESLQYTTSDAENDVYARFWASDLEYMVGQSNSGFVGLERAIEVGAVEGGESFLEHIKAFKMASETFRELTNKGHKALIQNFVKRFILGNELATQQDYIWMAINDVYKLIYVAKENESDTTKIAEYINELMNKYQAQTELEKLVNESAMSIKKQTENVVEDGIEYTEGKLENGKDVYGANVRYKGELSVIPLGRYETKGEVELKANEILENFKQKYESELSEIEKIEQEVRTAFPDADDETVEYHVKSRLQSIEDNKLFETAKMQYPIVIEWSEGTPEKNIGFDYLYELDKKIKSFGVTNEPKSYYIKTKVWFRDYPHDGKTDYVTIYNGHDVSDFNPEIEDVIDFLKRHYPNFDWTIYEYGDNYKFGHIPEPEFKAGDLVQVTIEIKGEERDSFIYEYGYVTDKKPTYIRRSENWKPHYIYDVVDMFDTEKVYHDVMEWRLRLKTDEEVKDELMKQKLRLGRADLLIKEEAELLADKYIGEINRLHEEYTKSGEGKYWKERFENDIYTQFYDWFSQVVSRYPLMLGQWLNMQVEKLPNYKEYLLNGFVDIDNTLTNLTQFFNSLNNVNKGKSKPKGIYELIPENFIEDKKTKQIDFEVEPSSSGLLSIMKPFFMKDDLRPVMSSINFDHRGATSTDAHRLMFLKGKTDKKGIYGFGKIAAESGQFVKRGKYLVGNKGMKYPKYQKVIPAKYSGVISLSRETVEKIVNSLRTFKNVNYYGKHTDKCHVSLYKGEVSAYNIKYLLDLLEAWLKIGFDKLEMTNKTESLYKGMARRTILIVSPDIKKFTNDLKGSGSILMAVMIDSTGEPNRDIERGEMYVDFNTGIAETAGVTDDLFSEFNAAHNTYGAETEKNEIDELQMVIDLLEDTVKENPSEENKDYLELLKDTLNNLRENNKSKFECGGKMYYNGGHLSAPTPYKDGGNLFGNNELDVLEQVNHINNMLFYRYYPVGVNPFEISFDKTNTYGYGIYFLDNPYFYKNKFTDGRLLTIKPNVQNPFIFTEESKKTPNGEYAEALLVSMKNDNIDNKDAFTRKMVEVGYDSLVVVEARGTYLILFSNDPDLYDVESDLSNTVIDEKNKNELDEKINLSIQNAVSKFPDLNTTEAQFIYNTFNKTVESNKQKEQPVWLTGDGFKGSMKKILLKKNYIDDFWSVFNKPMSYDRNEYALTEKGLKFISEVQSGLFRNNEMAKGGKLDKYALELLTKVGYTKSEIKWVEKYQVWAKRLGDVVKIKDIPNIKDGDRLAYLYKDEDDNKTWDYGDDEVSIDEQWGEWVLEAYPFNMQSEEIQENKNNPEFELKDIENHEYEWTLYHLKK